MIDTIKMAYPMDQRLKELIENNSHRLQKISPNGEVLWEKGVCQDALPSHFSGLRITTQSGLTLMQQGFKNARDMAFFEFSLAKFLSDTAYNHRNTPLEVDIAGLKIWSEAISEALQFIFDIEFWVLYRVDLAENFILEGVGVEEYLRCLELRFSRAPQGERFNRYRGGLAYGSSWIGKKLYWKYLEFMDIERKKWAAYRGLKLFSNERECGADKDKGAETQAKGITIDKRPLTVEEIEKLFPMLRFELEFRRAFLSRHEITNISSIPNLLAYYEKEKEKYMSVERLRSSPLKLSPRQFQVLDMVKRLGTREAKSDFLTNNSPATWYRVKKDLALIGIFLEAIDNYEWRSDKGNPENGLTYSLRLAE